MAAMSDYLEIELIKHIFRTGTFSKPSVLAIALCTAAPSDSSTGATITEVSATNTGYARVSANPADGTWAETSGTNGVTSNSSAITFSAATGDWGTITHVAILDSTTVGAGNVLFHGALSTSKTVTTGDIFSFQAGNLQITLA